MARGDAEMRIRIPWELKKWLEVEAERNVRSQTAQIIFLMRREMETQDTAPATRKDRQSGNSDGQI